MHPKQEEALRVGAARKEERALAKAALKTLVHDNSLHFVRHGNHTFAWTKQGRNVISFATSIRHPADHDDALLGRLVAATNFASGHFTTMKLGKGITAASFFLYLSNWATEA